MNLFRLKKNSALDEIGWIKRQKRDIRIRKSIKEMKKKIMTITTAMGDNEHSYTHTHTHDIRQRHIRDTSIILWFKK